jgi:hypothetical protein
VAKAALPGAAINAGLGLVTGGPVEALAYGAGDFLVNYPALRATRKFFPGTQQIVKDVATGKTTTNYAPSAAEGVVNLAASFGSNALVNAALYPQQAATATDAQQFLAQQAQQVNQGLQPQSQQTAQQLAQRSYVNRIPLNQMSLSPNTMYQMSPSFHYPGLTLPPEMRAELTDYVKG